MFAYSLRFRLSWVVVDDDILAITLSAKDIDQQGMLVRDAVPGNSILDAGIWSHSELGQQHLSHANIPGLRLHTVVAAVAVNWAIS